MTYKTKVKIISYEGDTHIINLETVGANFSGLYKIYFNCSKCKNQSISDDSGLITACNNYEDIADQSDKRLYCKNYERE